MFEAVSVKLPRSSTVLLPHEQPVQTGHITGMDLRGILARIDERLGALGLTDSAASKKAGKPDAIRNMRRAVKDGRAGVSTTTLNALALALECGPAWLITGEGDDTETEDVGTVPLIGYVAAGSAAHFTPAGQLGRVRKPDNSTKDTVAVEIRGESLGSFFDRWIVYYDDVRRPLTTDLIGRVCVAGLADGRVLVKQIKRAKKGRGFDLFSQSGEKPIRNVEIEWAARVKQMAPR